QLMRRLVPAAVVAVALAAAGVVAARAGAAPACTISWDGGGGTPAWGTADNWSGNVLPGAGDTVCIPATAAVVHGTGNDSVQSIQVAGALTLSGGTLTLTSTTDASS